MSENLEAQALADWLAGPPHGAVPDTLDADVAEAIIALRPEYAPPHTVNIESVLATLTEGPLVDPAIADALRQWLESKPGTPPPPNLPVGVVEATYALRPELAPSLGLNIDDVLNEVNAGPLAGAEVVPLQPQGGPPQTDRIASRALGSTRRKWWTGTAVTATAVAATTLLFVGPMADKAQQGPSHFTDARVAQATAMEEEEHPVAMMEPEAAITKSLERGVKAVEATPKLAIVPEKAAPARSNAAKMAQSARTRTPEANIADRGPSAAAPPPPVAVAAAPEAQRVRAQPMAADAGRPSVFGAISGEGGGTVSAPVGMADGAGQDGREFEEDGGAAAPEAYADNTQVDFEGLGLAQADEATPQAAPEPRRPSRRASRAQSQPYNAAAEQADAEANPRTRGNVSALQAVHAGQRLLDAGQFERALRKVESGLRASERDPIVTARLLRLKATILIRLGRETEAKQAREEAAKLDPLR
jgi:hypothetical protein